MQQKIAFCLQKSFEDYPHSPSFDWAKAVDKEQQKKQKGNQNEQSQLDEKKPLKRTNTDNKQQQNTELSSNGTSATVQNSRDGYKNAESPSNSEVSENTLFLGIKISKKIRFLKVLKRKLILKFEFSPKIFDA